MSDCIVSRGVALGISDPGFERGKKFVCVHHSPSSLELIGCHATFESVCLTRLRAPYQLKNRRIASQTAEKNPSSFFVVRASFSCYSRNSSSVRGVLVSSFNGSFFFSLLMVRTPLIGRFSFLAAYPLPLFQRHSGRFPFRMLSRIIWSVTS